MTQKQEKSLIFFSIIFLICWNGILNGLQILIGGYSIKLTAFKIFLAEFCIMNNSS
jgi:hypothetical protein